MTKDGAWWRCRFLVSRARARRNCSSPFELAQPGIVHGRRRRGRWGFWLWVRALHVVRAVVIVHGPCKQHASAHENTPTPRQAWTKQQTAPGTSTPGEAGNSMNSFVSSRISARGGPRSYTEHATRESSRAANKRPGGGEHSSTLLLK